MNDSHSTYTQMRQRLKNFNSIFLFANQAVGTLCMNNCVFYNNFHFSIYISMSKNVKDTI